MPAYFELSAKRLGELLDANARDEEGNIRILASDATAVTLGDDVKAEDVEALLVPEMEPRLVFAVEQGYTVIVPVGLVAAGGGGYFDVVAFDREGHQLIVDGCRPVGYYNIVQAWRDETRPGWTDLDAWRAIIDPGSPEAIDFDTWAEAAAVVPEPVPWVDLPPDQRQLNPADTPSEILEQLNSGFVIFNLDGLWGEFDGLICLRLEIAWGDCFRTTSGGAMLDGLHEPGKGFEIWLLEKANLDSALAKLGEVTPEQAAELDRRTPQGDQVLYITALRPAASLSELVDLANRGEGLFVIDTISLDEFESRP